MLKLIKITPSCLLLILAAININAQVNLQVAGKIKIVDGTQGAGKVLTSDASGEASWQAPALSVIDYFRSLPNGIQVLLDWGETPLNIINSGANTTDFIGLNYEGGIIFYIQSDGAGLVAASNDQSTGNVWGCYSTPIPGADGTDIGTGNQNTIDIVAECTATTTAADICAQLNKNGYEDWFLPSKDELDEMYLKIGQGASGSNQNIGDFGNVPYWSSSEVSSFYASAQNFGNDSQSDDTEKRDNLRVRAVRAF